MASAVTVVLPPPTLSVDVELPLIEDGKYRYPAFDPGVTTTGAATATDASPAARHAANVIFSNLFNMLAPSSSVVMGC